MDVETSGIETNLGDSMELDEETKSDDVKKDPQANEETPASEMVSTSESNVKSTLNSNIIAITYNWPLHTLSQNYPSLTAPAG